MSTDYHLAHDLTVYVHGRRIGKVYRYTDSTYHTTYHAMTDFPLAQHPNAFDNPQDAAQAVMDLHSERGA